MDGDRSGRPSGSSMPGPLSDDVYIIHEPVAYAEGWALQTSLHGDCVRGHRGDQVLILEHQPVYTLGRTAQVSHWGGNEDRLRAQGAEVHTVNRGGSVTYHGPGQIVVYPILRCARHARGPRQLVRLFEDLILRVLGRWQIEGIRMDKKPGIWTMAATRPDKIASIGMRIEQGVTVHGFALNVDLDLSPFDQIQPCGLADCSLTSMAAMRGRPTPVARVKRDVAACVAEVFPGTWRTVEKTAATDLSLLDTIPGELTAYART
jgi:lipoyl(octanoyl) transferase